MKNSGLLWWIGAFVLALLAGLLTYGLLSTSLPGTVVGSGNNAPNTTPVVVAVVDIPFRRSIREEELIVKNVPIDTVPAGAAVTIDQVVGKMSTVGIYANQPVLAQELVTPDVVTQQVALSVPDGKVVIAVPTDSKLISNRLIRPGDRIDVIATLQVEITRHDNKNSPMPVSISLLQNLEIHAIILPTLSADENPDDVVSSRNEGGVFRTPDESGQSVLLAVNPQDALAIRHILDVGGAIDLSLRPKDDETMTETTPVDQFSLAEDHGIDLNRN